MYLKQKRVIKAPIVAFYKLHKPGNIMSIKFLHISDLHVHADDSLNQDTYKTLDFIDANFPNHKIIITGDITDDGSKDQYEKAFSALERYMERGVYICPGNHDFGATGQFYSVERALRFDKLAKDLSQGGTFKWDNTPVVNVFRQEGKNIMLIALDSNLETESPFDFFCGEIGKIQLKSLSTILTTNPTFMKILFFHHHPFMVNNPLMEMKDAEKLARVVFNKVDVMLFGHKHEMKQWENVWGIKYVLASDNTPGKKFAKEVCIAEDHNISVNIVQII
jgi:3',5'-cyclic AMP phosphodiesterase CpdA